MQDNLAVELTEFILKKLVSCPDDLQVAPAKFGEGGRVVLLEINVHPDDVGRVIGKRGQMINALRAILKACCRDSNQYHLQIYNGKTGKTV